MVSKRPDVNTQIVYANNYETKLIGAQALYISCLTMGPAMSFLKPLSIIGERLVSTGHFNLRRDVSLPT